jgi:hypothetical protein
MRLMAPIERWLHASCRHFTKLASERMDRALTARERMFYRLHRWMCAICRKQDNRIRHLHELAGLASQESRLPVESHFSSEAREQLCKELAAEFARRRK